jgi:hypothetical protein
LSEVHYHPEHYPNKPPPKKPQNLRYNTPELVAVCHKSVKTGG